mgnify:CR=1 FL=1
MESPYTFCKDNKRVVLEVNGQPAVHSNKVMVGAGALYLFSMYAYMRRYLRIDGNAVTAGAFAVASAPASYAYARFFLSDAETEAALLNNDQE